MSKQEETYEKPRVSSSVQPHPATHPATTHPLLNSRDDIRVPSVLDRMLERLPEVADKAPPLQNSMNDSRPVAQGRAIETSSVPSIKGIGRSAEGETGAIEGKILVSPESPLGIQALNSATVVLPSGVWIPVHVYVCVQMLMCICVSVL